MIMAGFPIYIGKLLEEGRSLLKVRFSVDFFASTV
jgi:hypothetical protein